MKHYLTCFLIDTMKKTTSVIMSQGYGLLFLVSGVLSLTAGYVFHYPIEKDIHWYPANHSSLRCPIRSASITDTPTGGVTISIPSNPSNNDLPGFSCHKTEWISECTETWYWSTDVKQYIRPVSVTADECKKAQRDKEVGTEITPFFTAPVCQWSNTVRKVNSFVITNKKNVKFDPYNLDFIDPILVGGRCKGNQESCPTIQAGVIWLPRLQPTKATSWTNIYAKYKRVGPHMGDWKFWGGGMPTSTFKDACKMEFRGKEGIRVSSGFWFHIPQMDDVEFKTEYGKLAHCVSSKEIKFPSAHEEVAEHEMEIQDLILTLRCRDIIDKYEETGSISFMDLALFDPDNEGPAHIYRINKGKLEAGLVNYGECKVSKKGDPAESACVKVMDNGQRSPIFFQDWVPTGIKGIQSGFNGLYRENGEIKHAGYNLFQNKLTESDIQRMELTPIHHPVLLSLSDVAPGLNVTFDQTGERGELDLDLLPGITGIWRKFVEYLSMAALILTLIVSIFVVWKCCISNHLGPSKKTSEMEYFE
ncbi:G [Niakha virus]|uniref:G n=1 Tax=Niakha virus TaxID=1348439 RepID=R9ZPI5_9RHAB|nr:G [Niakha virus] [Niakha virus]AGO44083.1 G [Niakha virus] [Niakha virus]